MKYTPHDYQKYCIEYIREHPVSALFLDMGLGKTIITLTALNALMFDELKVNKVLVIAPLRVARDTWPAEVKKWDHLQNIEISVIVGSVKERTAAVNHNAFIYIVNRENVKWLVEYYEKNGLRWDFDMIVIDELSSFKNYQSQRFKWLRKVRPFVKRWVGLTGTPTSNGLMDLWSEIGILDGGERLGRFIGRFRESYFNGTLDLRTLEFHEHDPKDLITKISHINYDPNAVCPRWIQFVDEVMVGRKNVARYLQKAIGYSLSGDTSLECLFIMFGPTTRNGKTTTIETILRVMGEYGRSAKPDMLATNYFRGQSNGSSDDVARLAGARFVGISEMEQKLTINASLTKQLTGNGSITARFLYEGYFEFHMQAKIFIDTNHLPNVTDRTLFESGRLKIIPFTRHFEDHEQDKTLKTTLMQPENLSGILNWCIEGYRLYKAEGLDEPDEVKAATEEYRVESDRIAQFMRQCLKKEKGSEIKASAVYSHYKTWCSDNGCKYESSQNFYKRLSLEYLIVKRRPWKPTTTGNMNPLSLVNDVTWVSGEEPGMDLVPLDDEE